MRARSSMQPRQPASPASAAQLSDDWILPSWLRDQVGPGLPASLPQGQFPTNGTERNWTTTGVIGGWRQAMVDPTGLVTPWAEGWSLDWWVGADDRWHFPSSDSGVRQRLFDGAPVVETAMRIPGGDAVHRAYSVPGTPGLVVVEIENRSSVPFALALAVRPYNPEGLAAVRRIWIEDTTVWVDGRPALLLPKRPAAAAGSNLAGGDCAAIVTEGRAENALSGPVHCQAGLAQAALIFPLPHTAVLRVAMPVEPMPISLRRVLTRRPNRRPVALGPETPSAASVARGWAAQVRKGMRLELPQGTLADAVEANRRFLLLFHHGADLASGSRPGDRSRSEDASYLFAALDRCGFHRESAEALSSIVSRRRANRLFSPQSNASNCDGPALFGLAEHWRLTRDLDVVDLDWVEKAARRIERRRGEDAWAVRGLRDAGDLLAAGDRADSAARVRASASAAMEGVTADMVGSLDACWPLGLLAADSPEMTAAADMIRERFCVGSAAADPTRSGLSPCQTLQLAAVEVEAGDRRAMDRLQWVLSAATGTYTWPEVIHPQLGTGCSGHGHHGRAAAEFLSLVRNLLVREVAGGLALMTMVPDSWRGQPLEVHDAPTHLGRMSFALRWHGPRPALLWELVPHADVTGVRITAPGVDPTWSTTDLRGDALLGSLHDEADGR